MGSAVEDRQLLGPVSKNQVFVAKKQSRTGLQMESWLVVKVLHDFPDDNFELNTALRGVLGGLC